MSDRTHAHSRSDNALNYPPKKATQMLVESWANTKLPFGVQIFLEKTKTINNMKGSPSGYFEPLAAPTLSILGC